MELLDQKQIPLLAAVELAFISQKGQKLIESFFTEPDYVIPVDKAKELRKFASNNKGKIAKEDKTFLSVRLSQLQKCSIMLSSGEYGGRKTISCPLLCAR